MKETTIIASANNTIFIITSKMLLPTFIASVIMFITSGVSFVLAILFLFIGLCMVQRYAKNYKKQKTAKNCGLYACLLSVFVLFKYALF